jgi:hypothetical protein
MAKVGTSEDGNGAPPFETRELREQLAKFLSTEFPEGSNRQIGNYRWGVYAFYDYDLEPIYVGQTNEMLRTRIRRHLTNQRTDAVAMSVLDPFEVLEIEAWPLPQFQTVEPMSKGAAREHLNALERAVCRQAIDRSFFKAVLNEKDPPPGKIEVQPPQSLRGRIVSERVFDLRSHIDFRIARRALVISRLAQVIAERRVHGGLRRVLLTQARRLQWLAERRYEALGGAATVETEED